MKAIISKKWYGVPIVLFVMVAILGVGIIAWAATGQVTPVQHQATGVNPAPPPPPPPPPPEYTFELYEADGTTLAQPIQWGDVTIGTPKTKEVLITNTGTGTFSVVVDTAAAPAGWTIMATDVSALAPGATTSMTLTLSTSVAGVASFTTDFQAVY